MTIFLSDEWIEALDASVGAQETGPSADPLVVQYDVATENGPRAYHLILGPDRDRAVAGPAPSADVFFSMDAETALAISKGELSTEEAFITGKLELAGDATALIDAYRDAKGA